MTRTNLKILMLRKGFTLTKFASFLGVATTSVYDVIAGRMSSKKIEGALEAALEMPIADIRSAWNTEGKPEMTADIKAIAERVNKMHPRHRAAVNL